MLEINKTVSPIGDTQGVAAVTAADITAIRESPLKWFHRHGFYRDEETRQPRRGCANVLQRRMFEHYRRCQEELKPCRMVVLKYRRAGCSTAGEALVYLHAQNYRARLGVIGTDYKASSNMLEMLKFYGEHDDFPGWAPPKVEAQSKVPWQEWNEGQALDTVPWEERIERQIATRIDFGHDSKVELYTSKNPESARSAGLNGYHATESARWALGGEQDAGDTLTAMRNTLPKRGFHVALEESTANGAQGAFYETCKSARWPDYDDWWKQWQTGWSLTAAEYGSDLQFVFIFAAWYEDERHVTAEPLDPAQQRKIESTLDEDERQLIARFGQPGPQGMRLGSEVDATVWDQLAWRRGIIKTVCTKGGAEEFKVEYPSSPQEAFRSSGYPALDVEGVLAIEQMARSTQPSYGALTMQQDGRTVAWSTLPEGQCTLHRWEEPIIPAIGSRAGCRYLVTCDPMSGADAVTGEGNKDSHACFVLRDAYTDHRGQYWPVKVVARIRPPYQVDSDVVAKELYHLSLYYGGATIVVEANCGSAILKLLSDTYRANVWQREETNMVTQRTTKHLGWWTSEPSKRDIVATLQRYVREQMLDCCCRHAAGEMMTLIRDPKGRVHASGSNHDDDPISLAIGLECLHAAHEYPVPSRVTQEDRNALEWR